MKIQNIYKCKKYKPNDNLNKTCDNKARCKIYYDEVCNEYEEKAKNQKKYLNNKKGNYKDIEQGLEYLLKLYKKLDSKMNKLLESI